jgi:hypothetical protein
MQKRGQTSERFAGDRVPAAAAAGGGWVGLGRWERGEGNRGREKGGKKGGERKIAENEGRREGN